MDIRASQAARMYQAAMPATPLTGSRPAAGLSSSDPAEAARFSERAATAIQSFTETLQTAERTAQDAMVGKADPHALVEALSQSELAVEAVVAVRDRVVEAYQEILRMPV